MIGRVLNHYKILERIGRGGMGEVFLAEDTSLDRKVALKVLPEELSAHEERRQRFEREAKAVAALNHPNIVTIHSVEEAEGVHFITMELVRGKRLSEILSNGGMALSKFLELAVPIAEAVSAAHEQGITHRDLKPDNIMVTEKGQPKILDFGLAKLGPGSLAPAGSQLPTVPVTGEGRIVGTISHMSPEQAQGKAVDHRSDIFSLGVVFYEMLTGRRPFRGDNSASVLSSILKDTPPPVTELNPEIPRDLAKVCRRCLAKDPTRRYQTALDLRNELEELKQDLDSGTLEAPAAVPRRRGRLGVGVGAALALAVAIGVLVSLSLQDQTGPEALQIHPLTSFEGMEVDPSWSPDGNLIAYSVASGQERQLTSGTGDDESARVSPDGEKIAYNSNRTGNWEIWLLDLATGDERALTNHPGSNRLPDWSPDGRTILFVSDREGPSQLWAIDPEGGALRRLSEQALTVSRRMGFPRWSPDGARIGYLAPSDRGTALWVMDEDGTNARPLVFGVLHFEWYLDSQRVVYSRMGESGRELRAADLESGEEVLLLDVPHVEHRVSPDGRAVIYGDATSHINQQLVLLRLSLADPANGLPRPVGEPTRLTEGRGRWHTHSGGWSPGGEALVYTRDTDKHDIYIVENYR